MAQDAPEGVKPLLDITCAGGRAELAFVDLLTTITNGVPAYVHRYGGEFWDDLDAEPQLRRTFDAQMNWRFRTEASQIATRFDWSRFPNIVDVGGGDGPLFLEILHAHPDVTGRILDLEPTATAAGERLAAAGLQHRASAIAGSFFDPLPAGADAYLLSDILHDWDNEHARRILTECRRAATPYGTVVVVDGIRGQSTGTAIDLFMLMCFAGKERTVEELCELAADCGLKFDSAVRVSDERTALEFTAVPYAANEQANGSRLSKERA
jgi:2,7-dihydroxy-5-methyl-1-naphthoate 7-O-methyltransferase